MGFFDSIKNITDTAKNMVQEQMDAKAERDKAKAEAKAQAEAQANFRSEALFDMLHDDDIEDEFFTKLDMATLLSFTKDFFQKLVMPACSISRATLLMYPYTDDNVSKRNLSKVFADYNNEETIIFTWNLKSTKEYIALTDKFIYFKLALKDSDVPMFYTVKLPIDEIGTFAVEAGQLVINDITVVALTDELYKNDLINMAYYVECIEKEDFEIDEDEINDIIHKKIGDAVYASARKYMDEDDRIIYFAWGVDSLSAKDFLMCTNRQFVMLNREILGATQDVKRFYYEDITSMSVEQNEASLTGTLLNAALKLCHLIIYVAGTRLVIQNLSTPEAERVIEIYNQYKSEMRKAAAQPQKVVIENQQPTESPLDQLKKLNELKELGIISEDEFNTKKADILAKM